MYHMRFCDDWFPLKVDAVFRLYHHLCVWIVGNMKVGFVFTIGNLGNIVT